jgi:hypothetical protein
MNADEVGAGAAGAGERLRGPSERVSAATGPDDGASPARGNCSAARVSRTASRARPPEEKRCTARSLARFLSGRYPLSLP